MRPRIDCARTALSPDQLNSRAPPMWAGLSSFAAQVAEI